MGTRGHGVHGVSVPEVAKPRTSLQNLKQVKQKAEVTAHEFYEYKTSWQKFKEDAEKTYYLSLTPAEKRAYTKEKNAKFHLVWGHNVDLQWHHLLPWQLVLPRVG